MVHNNYKHFKISHSTNGETFSWYGVIIFNNSHIPPKPCKGIFYPQPIDLTFDLSKFFMHMNACDNSVQLMMFQSCGS